MHSGWIDILREVVVAGACSLRAYATTCLLTEVSQRSTLDISEVTHGHNDRIVWIEVLSIELMLVWDYLCTTLVAITLLHLLQLLLHHFLATLWVVQDLLQVGNEFHQCVILSMQLIHTQTGELSQAHVYDSLRLCLVEFETCLQVALGICRSL